MSDDYDPTIIERINRSMQNYTEPDPEEVEARRRELLAKPARFVNGERFGNEIQYRAAVAAAIGSPWKNSERHLTSAMRDLRRSSPDPHGELHRVYALTFKAARVRTIREGFRASLIKRIATAQAMLAEADEEGT